MSSSSHCIHCISTSNATHNTNTNQHELLTAKGSAMAILCLATFTMGMLPTIFSKWQFLRKIFPNYSTDKLQKVLSILLSFGGGVLMCTTYLHLLPEVREQMETFKETGLLPNTNVNVAELVMCFGFFIMYLLEECVHAFLHHRKHKKEERQILINESEKAEVLHHTLSFRKCKKDSLSKHLEEEEEPYAEYSKTSLNVNNNNNNNYHSPVNYDNQDKQAENEEVIFYVKSVSNPMPVMDSSDMQEYFKSAISYNKYSDSVNLHKQILPDNSADMVGGSLRGLLIVLALSVHELFEGLAVGLEKETSNVWYMSGSVAAHKFVIAFCVGIELFSSKISLLLTIVYVGTFAVVSPIGIAIGMSLTSQSSSEEVANAFLQGIATGTLMYVIFFEILKRDNHDHKKGLADLLSIVIGFSIMAGLVQIGD